MYVTACYFAYIALSLSLTVWVARTLHRNGRVFLIEAFQGNQEMADSVNHLLVVGFYLVNIGYVALALKTAAVLHDLRGAIELVSVKVGAVLLILGAMHFFNLYVFNRMRVRGARMNAGRLHAQRRDDSVLEAL
jgi:cytochrome c biogenesis protein CcdA